MHFSEIFGRKQVYQLPPEAGDLGPRRSLSPEHLNGRLAFADNFSYEHIEQRFRRGAELKTTKLSEQFDYDAFLRRYGSSVVSLFRVSKSASLSIVTADGATRPRAGETLIALVEPPEAAPADEAAEHVA